MINKNLKGISSVVAISLFLVLTVSAVVGFQTWFQTHSSGLYTEVESKDLTSSSGIESLVGNELFFKNSGSRNVSINKIKVGDNNCEVNINISSGVKSINLGTCLENESGSTEVVIYSDDKIFSKSLFISKSSQNSLMPLTGICKDVGNGDAWVEVPGNSQLGTQNFCVMKYDAKAYNTSSGNFITDGTTGVENWANISTIQARSVAEALPFREITWTKNREFCNDLGENYSLITEAQWQTLAYDIIDLEINWDSGIVGQGAVVRGNSNGSLGILNASNPLSGINRRTHYLSNGEVIWDLAGNTWTRVNESILQEDRYGGGNQNWMQYYIDLNESDMPSEEFPPNGWNHEQGMGEYYDGWTTSGTYNSVNDADECPTNDCSDTAVYIRGGNTGISQSAGIFANSLDRGPSDAPGNQGFRCTYVP